MLCHWDPSFIIYLFASFTGALGNSSERGWCFYHLAEAYRNLGKDADAERTYHVAYQIFEDSGMHSVINPNPILFNLRWNKLKAHSWHAIWTMTTITFTYVRMSRFRGVPPLILVKTGVCPPPYLCRDRAPDCVWAFLFKKCFPPLENTWIRPWYDGKTVEIVKAMWSGCYLNLWAVVCELLPA